ncbi:MAG TPA: HAMP domain-containing protein [Sedimenticola sp.]|nr:HAMP domain-containing protein [Sedimenticola sp.]
MAADRQPSIRRRLLVVLMLVIAATWLGVGIKVNFDAHHEVEEVYDANLAQTARMLVGLMIHEIKERQSNPIGNINMDAMIEHPYETKIAMRVRYPSGTEALRSSGAPDFPDDAPHGFHSLNLNGQTWRVFSLLDKDTGLWVQTGQRLEVRQELVDHIVYRSLASLLVGLPVFALVIWWSVGRGLRPLERLGGKVEAMDPEALHPVDDRGAPEEVHILVISLNRLFARLRQTLEKERHFTADAAHELRTPLAAIKTQAQVAQRATDDAQRKKALASIIDGVDRATHLAGQLLTLARADAAYTEQKLNQTVDLYPIAKETLAAVASDAMARNIEVSLESGEPGYPLTGDAAMLGIMLRNLVDNALKYSPDGGRLKVRLARTSSAIELSVTDSGPGIPEEKMAELFQRFKRGNNSTMGAGLGLSIVKRICDIHHADIGMSRAGSGGGLKVSIKFPA